MAALAAEGRSRAISLSSAASTVNQYTAPSPLRRPKIKKGSESLRSPSPKKNNHFLMLFPLALLPFLIQMLHKRLKLRLLLRRQNHPNPVPPLVPHHFP